MSNKFLILVVTRLGIDSWKFSMNFQGKLKQTKISTSKKLQTFCRTFCQSVLRLWCTKFTERGYLFTDVTTSWWGSLWEQSSSYSWFSTFYFRNASEKVPDCTRAREFRKKSSSVDWASRIRLSVLLNSKDNFFGHSFIHFFRNLSYWVI